jgi:p-aminobenzoyl-glutamate transporter AbgT
MQTPKPMYSKDGSALPLPSFLFHILIILLLLVIKIRDKSSTSVHTELMVGCAI